jgi:hypothetical protein
VANGVTTTNLLPSLTFKNVFADGNNDLNSTPPVYKDKLTITTTITPA